MGFPSQEYLSGFPCRLRGYLPKPGIKPRSPALHVGSLLSEPRGKSNLKAGLIQNLNPRPHTQSETHIPDRPAKGSGGLVAKLGLTSVIPWTTAYHSLLQGIFPTQGLTLGFLHCRQTLYYLGHQGSPSISISKWVSFSPNYCCLKDFRTPLLLNHITTHTGKVYLLAWL